MKNVIMQIVDVLEQHLELNFFIASRLIELSPADDQDFLNTELHAKLSLLIKLNLEAGVALNNLAGKRAGRGQSLISKLSFWIKNDI